MRVLLKALTNFCGIETEEIIEVDDNTSEATLQEKADEYAEEMFVRDYYFDIEDEDEDEDDAEDGDKDDAEEGRIKVTFYAGITEFPGNLGWETEYFDKGITREELTEIAAEFANDCIEVYGDYKILTDEDEDEDEEDDENDKEQQKNQIVLLSSFQKKFFKSLRIQMRQII